LGASQVFIPFTLIRDQTCAAHKDKALPYTYTLSVTLGSV
jgi:hypothetical protein